MNYYITNTTLYQMTLGPLLSLVGIEPQDKTYGRKFLPPSPQEQKLRTTNRFYQEKFISRENKSTIYYQTWWDKEKFPEPKAEIIHVHGYADYGGRFADVCHNYLDAGYRMHVPDLPGHGRSDGVHCNVDNLNGLVDAVKLIVDQVKLDYKDYKVFLSGGSMGGLTVVKYGLENPNQVNGILAVCPAIDINPLMVPPVPVIMLARAIKSFAPLLVLEPRKDNMAASDPKIDDEFKNDPHTYSWGVRISTGLALFDGTLELQSKLDQFKEPVLIQIGDKDRMVSYEATKQLYNTITSKDKIIKVYEGLEHELHRVKGSEYVFQDALQWIEERL